MGQVWEWITGGIRHLLAGLTGAVPAFVGKFLAAYGLTMVSFKAVLPNLKTFVMQFVTGMPAEALNFLGAIGLGQAMSMVISALLVSYGSKMFFVPKTVADQMGAGGSP